MLALLPIFLGNGCLPRVPVRKDAMSASAGRKNIRDEEEKWNNMALKRVKMLWIKRAKGGLTMNSIRRIFAVLLAAALFACGAATAEEGATATAHDFLGEWVDEDGTTNINIEAREEGDGYVVNIYMDVFDGEDYSYNVWAYGCLYDEAAREMKSISRVTGSGDYEPDSKEEISDIDFEYADAAFRFDDAGMLIWDDGNESADDGMAFEHTIPSMATRRFSCPSSCLSNHCAGVGVPSIFSFISTKSVPSSCCAAAMKYRESVHSAAPFLVTTAVPAEPLKPLIYSRAFQCAAVYSLWCGSLVGTMTAPTPWLSIHWRNSERRLLISFFIFGFLFFATKLRIFAGIR